MIETLQSLSNRKTLNPLQSEQLMTSILAGRAQPEQIGAVLTAMHFHPPTGSMIAGFVRAFRAETKIGNLKFPKAIDVCGTGGDGLGTFNVSTAVAFIAAAAGAMVAKHGNRAVSSRCGSFDVLEALGIPFSDTEQEVQESMEKFRLAFMYAPSFHPVMRNLLPVRKSLGFRTVFNILGPLLNPATVERQLIGVYSEALVVPVAEALGELGSKYVMVVHGLDGSDEISLTGPTRMAILSDGRIKVSTFDPSTLGFKPAKASSLKGGDAQENAQILRDIFSNHGGACQEIAELNAAAALMVAGRAEDLKEGLALARKTLSERLVLQLLTKMSQEFL